MTDDNKSQETQQELFQQFSSAPKRLERFPALSKTQKPILVSTTLEQLLMAGIVFILVLCGVFFLGVLRGKSLREPQGVLIHAARPEAVRVPQASPVPRPALSEVPAPSVPPAQPSAVSAAVKPYTIQLVTYRKKEYAETELTALRKMGHTGFILQKGEYFQVYSGQYASKDEAKKDLSLFQSRYKDSFLTRRA